MPDSVIPLAVPVLSKNDAAARENRKRFDAAGLLVLNVVSSPGSGKTTFLSRTLQDVSNVVRCAVIVGDLATDNDAQRLRVAGTPAVQVQTGTVCHLDATMVARAADQLALERTDVLIIENVGNLVCPAAYRLGEDLRIVLLSVTEGEDKPLKYPTMFKSADVVVITKTDMAAAAGFDRTTAHDTLAAMCPSARVFEVSARTGEGMVSWYRYLTDALALSRGATR